MSEAPRQYSRRDFLRLAVIPFAAACSEPVTRRPSSNAQPSFFNSPRAVTTEEIPPVEAWPVVNIPIDGRPGTLGTRIAGVNNLHFPEIGLLGAWIVSERRYHPWMAIATIWDSRDVKIPGVLDPSIRSDLRLDGRPEFQVITDPFIPETGSAENEYDVIVRDERSQSRAAQLAIRTTRLFAQGINYVPTRIFIAPRPTTDQPLALVFDGEVVEFNGQASEPAYLAAQLVFEADDNLPILPSPNIKSV